MKKIFGIYGITLILIGSIIISPAIAINIDEDYEELELNRKLLLVIAGNMKICWEDKLLYGFGLIVYTDGEISTFTNYSIKFQGFPFFINKGFLTSFCVYKPAET